MDTHSRPSRVTPPRLLPLIPASLLVQQVLAEPDRVVVVTTPETPDAACPLCGRASGRVHSRYPRTLADLPWQGRRVVVQVRARRFRCALAGCPRRVFAERLPEVARPWARRTERLGAIQRQIGSALGGMPGARLALRLALPASGDTLLRLVGRASKPPARTPRVLGVDDWAWRRGQSLVDLEERRVVDLLPDREAATLAAWLRARPGVEVVARDRAGAYADGIRTGAPGAVQVADRRHLLKNCSDALQLVLDRNLGRLRDAARAVVERATARAPPPPPRPPNKLERHSRHRLADRDARFAEVARLAQAGMGTRAIARETGLAQGTVRGWLAGGRPPTWLKGGRPSIIDPFVPHLHRRLAEGRRNATELWREIRDRGSGQGVRHQHGDEGFVVHHQDGRSCVEGAGHPAASAARRPRRASIGTATALNPRALPLFSLHPSPAHPATPGPRSRSTPRSGGPPGACPAPRASNGRRSCRGRSRSCPPRRRRRNRRSDTHHNGHQPHSNLRVSTAAIPPLRGPARDGRTGIWTGAHAALGRSRPPLSRVRPAALRGRLLLHDQQLRAVVERRVHRLGNGPEPQQVVGRGAQQHGRVEWRWRSRGAILMSVFRGGRDGNADTCDETCARVR